MGVGVAEAQGLQVGPVKPLKNISKWGPLKPNKGKYKISQKPT